MNAQAYERFIGKIVEGLIKNDLVAPPGITHLKKFQGKTGALYEIDLSYTFRVVGAEYLTLIECKYWNKPVGRDIINSFKSIVEDIGAHKGIVVTTVGFQEGALVFAKKCGIGLFKASGRDHSLYSVQRLLGPTEDIENFLLTEDRPLGEEEIREVAGTTTARIHLIDYVRLRYGEEVAAFLAHDDVESISQLKDSGFKTNLIRQLKTMGKEWISAYLQIESCGMPIIVEPQLYFRLVNLKLHTAMLEIEKAGKNKDAA